MKISARALRAVAWLLALLTLSGMAGCPNSPDFQNGDRHTDGPPDRAGSGGGMDRSMGGGMGGMGMP